MDDRALIQGLVDRHRRSVARRAMATGALRALVHGALAAIVVLTLAKLAGVPSRFALAAFAALPIALIVGAVVARRRHGLSDYHAAKQLDDLLGTKDRIATAYFLLSDGAPESPFIELAIADGVAAARGARVLPQTRSPMPRSAAWGLIGCVGAVGLAVLFYRPHHVAAGHELSQESTEEVGRMLRDLGELQGLSTDQKQEITSALASIGLTEEEMKKMSQSEIMEALAKKGYKGGAGGEKGKVLEAVQGAVAQLDLMKQQLAEIEAKNKQAFQITLSDGRTVTGTRIQTRGADEKISASLIKRTLGVKEADSALVDDLMRDQEASASKASDLRTKLGLRTSGTSAGNPGAVLVASEQFRKDTEEAIRDPNSEAGKRVQRAHHDVDRKEIANGDYSAGEVEKLQKWLDNQ